MLRVVKLLGLGAALVALVVSVIGISVESLSFQPYTVCPSGCPFSKIQAALDAAKNGETITVGPGVYRENLTITKSVSLVGAGPAQVRLMPSAQDLPLIAIGELSDEITIEQLRLEGFTLQQTNRLTAHALYIYDVDLHRLTFVNNRLLNPDAEASWMATVWGDEVTVERNLSSRNSTLDIAGRKIRVVNNDLFEARVNPFFGDGGNEALVEGNIFREEGLGVSGNAVVRKNQFRSAVVGIGVGGNPFAVELVHVVENEFIGPGLLRSPDQLSYAITVGNSGDRVLIEENRITNYDVGIVIESWADPSPEITIRKNVISQGIQAIWLKESRQLRGRGSRVEIVENAIDRQRFPEGKEFPLGNLSAGGAGLVVDYEVRNVEVVFQGNTLRLGEHGVVVFGGPGRIDLQGNKIIDNDLWGVVLVVPPCVAITDPASLATMQVTGSGNEIANNGKKLPPEVKALGDGEGNVCPKELISLKK